MLSLAMADRHVVLELKGRVKTEYADGVEG